MAILMEIYFIIILRKFTQTALIRLSPLSMNFSDYFCSEMRRESAETADRWHQEKESCSGVSHILHGIFNVMQCRENRIFGNFRTNSTT